MPDEPKSIFSAFSRVVLPDCLFKFPADQDSMLLSNQFGKAIVKSAWKSLCESCAAQPSPAGDAIDVETQWIGGGIASVLIHLPPPQQVGEAHLALCTLPARPDDGPRRYFTLEVKDGPAASEAPATVLYEWLPEDGQPDYRQVQHVEGIEPTPEAFGAAIDRWATRAEPAPAKPTPAKSVPQQQPSDGPADKPAAPPLFTSYLVQGGTVALRKPVAREELFEHHLKNCSAMLTGIRATAAPVIRANPATGEVQTVGFGFEFLDLCTTRPAEVEIVRRDWPECLFTISSQGKPLVVSLVIPENAPVDAFRKAAWMLICLSGEAGPAAAEPEQQYSRTLEEIMATRPAVISILARAPGDQDNLADTLGFNLHFGAAILLENKPPATAPSPSMPSAPAIQETKANSETGPSVHVHCKSILISAQQSHVESQRSGRIVRTTTDTSTTDRMDSVQEHQFDIAVEAIRNKASALFWQNASGGTIALVAIYACVGALAATAVLTIGVFAIIVVATGDKSGTLLPSVAGAAVIVAIALAIILPKVFRSRYAVAQREAKTSLVADEVRRLRNLSDGDKFEVIHFEDWQYFVQRLARNG